MPASEKTCTIAAIERAMIGAELLVAGHVWLLGHRVEATDIDLHGDPNRVVDLDAEVANGAPDFQMAEQELNRSEVPSPSVDQH
jgi:hypothetical protein